MTNPLDQTGEIVTWNPPSSVQHSILRLALSNAGLDPDLSPPMQPKNGFKRATTAMKEGRIIREVDDDGSVMTFQFTKEFLDTQQQEFEYSTECKMYLHKANGMIVCARQDMEDLAKEKFAEKMASRNASDVSRIVQALFKANGDLFPLRDSGGAYFVPAQHLPLVRKCAAFIKEIGGSMPSWEIHNTANAAQANAEAIRDTLNGWIDDYKLYAEQINDENPKSVKCAAAKIAEIRFKLSNYRTLLQSFDGEIEQHIKDVEADLAAKVNGTPEAVAAPEPVVEAAPISEAQKLLAQLLG
jgi:hypothetical protein